MTRPNFLLIEPEPGESLSVRKLILETAKFNVLTAHSGREGLELLKKFPNLTAVVVHSGVSDVHFQKLVTEVKNFHAEMPVILLATHEGHKATGTDYRVSSHSPEELLDLVREIFGDPRAARVSPGAARSA